MADKHVNHESINVSLDKLTPTSEQSERMWERLAVAMEERENSEQKTEEKTINIEQARKNRSKKKGVAYHMMQAAAAIAVILMLGVAANSMTGGQVYASIKELLQFGQSRQDVVGNIADIQKRLTEVYAPEIYSCDGKMMVFGMLRGLIVYDMEQGMVAATIDTQKIDCVYYNSDRKHTRVVKKGDKLIVFNMLGEEVAEGNYYVFDLSQVCGGELTVSETGNDAEKMNAYVDAWKKQDENYTDTFDFFCEDKKVGNIIIDSADKERKYSERSIVWTDVENKTKNCFIYVENGLYYYSIYDYETDIAESVIMNLEEMIAGGADPQNGGTILPVMLPEFTYTGNNPAIAAIWEYNKEDAMSSYGYGEQTVIPGYVVYKEVQAEDELLVFGNFFSYGFQLTGKVLECTSGGEMPACFHLKETEEGYEVVSVDVAGDGVEYDRKIREFTKDYPEVYEMYFFGDETEDENAMKEYVSMYVRENNLDVQYMKEYGWDPVPLFE